MRLVFDIEANGFYEEADTIWCIVTKDVDSGLITQYYENPSDLSAIQCGFIDLANADELIGHNIIDYDLRLIKKLYPAFDTQAKIIDTMIISQLLRPDRYGGHSLEAWGNHFGRKKPEHEDWTQFSPEMLHRCTEDVEINYLTYTALQEEMYEPIEGIPYKEIFTGG